MRPAGSALGVRPAGSALGVRPAGSALGVQNYYLFKVPLWYAEKTGSLRASDMGLFFESIIFIERTLTR